MGLELDWVGVRRHRATGNMTTPRRPDAASGKETGREAPVAEPGAAARRSVLLPRGLHPCCCSQLQLRRRHSRVTANTGKGQRSRRDVKLRFVSLRWSRITRIKTTLGRRSSGGIPRESWTWRGRGKTESSSCSASCFGAKGRSGTLGAALVIVSGCGARRCYLREK